MFQGAWCVLPRLHVAVLGGPQHLIKAILRAGDDVNEPPVGDRPWALGPGFHGALGAPGPVVLGLVGLWVGRLTAASLGSYRLDSY